MRLLGGPDRLLTGAELTLQPASPTRIVSKIAETIGVDLDIKIDGLQKVKVSCALSYRVILIFRPCIFQAENQNQAKQHGRDTQ